MEMKWKQLVESSIDSVLEWCETQDWCQAMMNCQQELDWHAEGDVWTHTKLVVTELEKLDEWSRLSQRERTLLLFTAIFHDSAKPLTTELDPATNRIRSPKHSIKGEKLTRNVLRQVDCDLETREEISRLVRYHGRPWFLLQRGDVRRELIAISQLLENRLLYLFSLADFRGRLCKDSERGEETLHYWKLIAEEIGCYDAPFAFANESARFEFFRKEDFDYSYVPYEDFSCHVTMVAGLPGAGKDYWLANEKPGLPHVSLDEVREEFGVDPRDDQGTVAQVARERCRELLRSKDSFAFNATNLLSQTRAKWIQLFLDYGARVEVVYIEPPLKTIVSRNSQREKSVPREVILRLAERCEPPTLREAHSVKWIS